VWVAVAQRLERFVGDERALRCWLFTIARNRLADHRRVSIRRRTGPLPAEDIERRLEPSPLVDPAHLVVEAADAQGAIDLLVDRLPPSQAEVVLLRVVGGFDSAEVASITGRSPGAVRVLQHRALKRLAAAIRPEVVTG
jgi:RNA polymerase sigma-70 factor (ECF subfamily)